jgi:hypothetical protein
VTEDDIDFDTATLRIADGDLDAAETVYRRAVGQALSELSWASEASIRGDLEGACCAYALADERGTARASGWWTTREHMRRSPTTIRPGCMQDGDDAAATKRG